ncbi:MAG: hypothetical protein CVU61_15730 [Deltaproteobacteria bacterium HGW-Deltaproteobacteria-19]|jgi:hypothetical protein|nr:MAG: hypothetical protein CVU61_15730 [Deltaproteobacteria bacterium HGW-Deltaproteobacteria-19]
MITFFCLPKPFHGTIGTIQRNAIRSWLALEPVPEIILFGNEQGTAEAAEEYRLRHIADVERNEYGTPLVHSMFRLAQEQASNPHVCYLNADIILLGDFMQTFLHLLDTFADGRILLTGLRRNVDIREEINFTNGSEAEEFLCAVKSNASIDHVGLDYFVFPRGSYRDVKPFAVGRAFLDAWFLYKASIEGLRLIDGTQVVTALHQNHSSIIGAGDARRVYHLFKDDPEIRRNHDLCGMYPRTFSFLDARYVLTESGILSKSLLRRMKGSILSTLSIIAYDILYPMYPYSYPLLWLGSTFSNRLLIRKWIVK